MVSLSPSQFVMIKTILHNNSMFRLGVFGNILGSVIYIVLWVTFSGN